MVDFRKFESTDGEMVAGALVLNCVRLTGVSLEVLSNDLENGGILKLGVGKTLEDTLDKALTVIDGKWIVDSLEFRETVGRTNSGILVLEEIIVGAEILPLVDSLPLASSPLSSPLPSPLSLPLPSPLSSPLPSPLSLPLPSPLSLPLPSPLYLPLPSPLS